MAEIESNIKVNIDTTQALASIKLLQSQISAFHTAMRSAGAQNAATAAQMQKNLIDNINATGKFSAQLKTIKTSAEHFTTALEKNKLTMGEYFRYSGAATKSFGKLFKSEFETINKVARERVKDLQTQYIKMGRDANGAMKAIAVRPLALDMENLGTKTAMAAQRQQILNQLLKQGSTNLLNFGKNTQWAGRQLMMGFTLPLAMFAGAAVKSFNEIEMAMVKIKRVYGDLNTTSAETEKMAKDLQKLAESYTQYGIAVKDTLDMAATAAATGKTGADLLAQVNQANKLAVLGGIDQAKALETTITLTNTFKTSAKDLGANIDFLNSVENQTILNIDDLTTAIPKAAPVVKQLGGNVKDLAVFMTAMREGGINASEGANAIKSGLASMINPTKAATDMLTSFGVNLKGIVSKDKGDPKQMIYDLAYALDRLEPLKRAQAIEKLFGKFQFARMSTLLQNIIDPQSQAAKVMELSKATEQELAILSKREMDKVKQSPAYQFKKAMADFQEAMAPVGREFLKIFTPIMKGIGDFLKGFNNLGEGPKTFIVTLIAAVAGLGPILLMTFGLISNGIANLIKGFVALKSFFNRTGNASKTLGEQTQYMTSEQIQAAAVAASLDQSHSKLTQTFTSEAVAIQKLIAEYERAVVAQNAMLGGRALPGAVRGRRFADGGIVGYAEGGVIAGPGTGTSDSIVARVSNGEAIIPAKSVARYPGLVSQLVSGNVPGFAGGTEFAHITTKNTVSVGAFYDSLIAAEKNGMAKFSQARKAMLQDYIATFGRDMKLHTYSGLGFTQDRMLNQGMKDGRAVPASAFLSDFKAQGMSKWNDTLRMAGVSQAAVAKDLEQYDHALQQGVQKMLDANKNATITSEQFEQIHIQAKSLLPAESKLRQALESAATGIFEVRANINERMLAEAGVPAQSVLSGTGSGKMSTKKRWFAPSGRQYRTGGNRWYRYSEGGLTGMAGGSLSPVSEAAVGQARAAGSKVGIAAGQGMVQGAKAELEIASPSRKLMDIGRQAAQGLINGTKQGLQKVTSGEVVTGTFNKISQAVKTGAAKLSAAGDEAVTKYWQKVDMQIKAENELGSQRMAVIEKMLIADDEEFAAQNARLEQIRQRVRDTNTTTQLEQRQAAELSANIRAKKEAIYLALEADDEEAAELRQRAALAAERGALTQEEMMLMGGGRIQGSGGVLAGGGTEGGKSPSGMRKFGRIMMGKNAQTGEKMFKGGGKLMGAGMAASSAVMMASMIPGKIGEEAQKLMMPVMALSMILPMLTSPLGALVVGIGAAVLAVMALNAAFDDAQKKAMETANTYRGSTDAIQKFAVYNNKVTGSEIMDLKRKDSMASIGIQTGKGTYGEIFSKTDQGKQLSKHIASLSGKGQSAQAVSDLSNQLQGAVMSGAMTMAQAKSLAMNEAVKAGNMKVGIEVVAKLNKIFGPNGEDITKNPLQVRVNMVKENNERMNQSFQAANTSAGGQLATANAISGTSMVGGTVVGAGVGMLAAGAIAAGSLGPAAIGAAIGSSFPVVGTIIGAGVGLAIGAFMAWQNAKAFEERAGKLTGAALADAKIALEQNKQMVDSMDVYYQKKIEELRLQGKINEANKLQNKYEQDRQAIVDATNTTKQQLIDNVNAVDQTNGAVADKYISGAESSVKTAYKNNVNETMYLDPVFEQLKQLQEGGKLTKGQRVMLNMEMSSKDIAPSLMNKFVTLMTNDETQIPVIMDLIQKKTGGTASLAADVLGMIDDKNGGAANKRELLLAVRAETNDKKSQDLINAVGTYARTQGVTGDVANIGINFVLHNTAAMKRYEALLSGIDAKKPKTFSALLNIITELKTAGGNDAKLKGIEEGYFNKLKDQNQKITYSTVLAELVTIPDPQIKASSDYNAWLSETSDPSIGFIGGADPMFAGMSDEKKIAYYRHSQAVQASQDAAIVASTVAPPKPTGGSGGPQASWLDDVVKKTRQFVDARQKLTTGWEASAKAIRGMANNAHLAEAAFNGMAQKLRAAGASEALVQQIMENPSDFKKVYKNGKLTKTGTKINNAMNNNALGEAYSNSQGAAIDSANKIKALKELTKLTGDLAGAQALANDAAVATAIAQFNSVKHTKAETEAFNKKIKAMLKMNNLAEYNARIAAGDQGIIDRAQKDVDVLQSRIAVWSDGLKVIEDKEKTINDAYDKRIKALDEVQKANENIAAQQRAQLDLADALSKGDIAAAARAAQAMRAQNAQQAIERQKANLTKARDNQLAAQTVTIGGKEYTRDQLETMTRNAENQVNAINLNTIDPAKQRIAEADQAHAQAVDAAGAAAGTGVGAVGGGVNSGAATNSPSGGNNNGTGGQSTQTGGTKPVTYPAQPRDEYGPPGSKYMITYVKDGKGGWKKKIVKQPIQTRTTHLPRGWEYQWDFSKHKWIKAKSQSLINDETQSSNIGNANADTPNGQTFPGTVGNDAAHPILPGKLTAGARTIVIPKGKNFRMPKGNYFVSAKWIENGAQAQIKYQFAPNASNYPFKGTVEHLEGAGFDGKDTLDYWQTWADGGIVMPNYLFAGGAPKAIGTDTIPAMLTPGEFVVRRSAVDNFGVDNLKSINNGTYEGDSVYNYNVSVNVSSMSDPDQIARTVMDQIRQVDTQRIRGNKF